MSGGEGGEGQRPFILVRGVLGGYSMFLLS